MEDGNKQATQQIAEAAATAATSAVSQLVLQMQKNQQTTSEKKESHVEKKIKSLLEKGGVDKDNLNELSSLLEAKEKDILEKVGNSTPGEIAKITQGRYTEAITDAVDKYIEGDDKLSLVAKHFERDILEKLSNDATINTKFNRGEVDKRKINDVAKEVIESYSKEILGRDRPAKGVTMESKVNGATGDDTIDDNKAPANIDDIQAPHRREAYFKLKALYMRNKVKPEEAHKRAYAMATKEIGKRGA